MTNVNGGATRVRGQPRFIHRNPIRQSDEGMHEVWDPVGVDRALDHGSAGLGACSLIRSSDWERTHPTREDDLKRINEEITDRQRTMRQYMAAFEKGALPPAICGERLHELETEIASLEDEHSVLEVQLARLPQAPSDDYLALVGRELEAVVKGADAAQLKKILNIAIKRIEVESRAFIQPFFKVPGVRMTTGPRRRKESNPTTGFKPVRGLEDRYRARR